MRSILSLHVFLILFLVSQRVIEAVVTSSRKGHHPIVSTKDPSGCAQHCDVQRCARVYPDTCEGWVEKDSCGCCPICNTSRPSVRSVISSTSAVKNDRKYSAFSFSYYCMTMYLPRCHLECDEMDCTII